MENNDELPESKRCTLCGEVKPLLDFPKRKGTPDGLHWWCFDCKRAKDREYGENWRAKHPEQKRRTGRRYARKDDVRARNSHQALLEKYGLTPEAFDAKLAAQGGKCPFCPDGAPPPAIWHVDHDHECCAGAQTCGGCLRDILCHKHNIALGYFGDDPEMLRAAADYIEWHRARIEAAGTTPWQPKGVASGERHRWWKGDDASPDAMRQRAWKALGSADHCVNGCVSARYEWVCARDADPADPASYVPMCHSCNIAYHGHAGAGHANAKLTAEQVAEIRSRYVRGQKPTQWDLAREYGVSQGVISSVVRGEKYVA